MRPSIAELGRRISQIINPKGPRLPKEVPVAKPLEFRLVDPHSKGEKNDPVYAGTSKTLGAANLINHVVKGDRRVTTIDVYRAGEEPGTFWIVTGPLSIVTEPHKRD